MNQIIQFNYMNGLENGQQSHRAQEVMIISCIVKADDTSKESIEFSSKLGLRHRKILSDQSVTASLFTRSFVENKVTYIRTVCDDLSGDSNCNVTMSYGNGTTTNIMVRYDDKSGEPIFVGSLLMQIKITENGMTSLVLPKDKLYQLFQSYATCPPEVYIAPAKSALLWEISSVDSSDEEVKENTTTILLNVNDEDEIYSVQVDPTDTAIKEFTKSDSTITKKSAARTARISASEDEEEAAPVPKAKRKADTKEPEEKVSKRTKVAGQKQAEKAIVESTEKEAPKKGRSRSRSASIVEEKDDSNITPSTKAAASRKKRKDSIAESIASEGTQTSKKIKKQFDLDKVEEAQAEEEDIESMDSVELERKSSSKKKNPKKMTITKETDDAKEKGDTIKTPTKAATIKATEGEEEKSDTTKKINQPTKKNKDPNAPKRPPTTYLLFCKEYRQKVVQENPGKTTQEIGMILGATYKKLKTEARAKYQKDADKLKQQFLKDVENYEKNKVEGGSDSGDKSDEEEEAPETVKRKKRAKKDPLASEEIHEKNEVEGGSDSGDKSDEEEKAPETVKRKKIAKKDPLAPKKALSSYMFFCSSKRPELKKAQPKLTVPEMAKLMGKMWQDATDATKVPFDVMAKKDKERYKSEMETFKSSS